MDSDLLLVVLEGLKVIANLPRRPIAERTEKMGLFLRIVVSVSIIVVEEIIKGKKVV